MRKYSFENVNNIFVIGDCHGKLENAFNKLKCFLYIKDEDADKPHPKEIERQERNFRRMTADIGRPGRMATNYYVNTLKKKMKCDSLYKPTTDNASLYIVPGDSGIDAKKNKELLERYNRIFSYNNIYFIIIRGNEDDPSMFDGEAINLSNIKAVPDYSVVQTAEKNILCIGGAVSMDRAWKINQEKLTSKFPNPKKFYWEDEKPVFNEEAIKDITKECKIDYVVSHSAPSFINVSDNISDWSKKDEKLSDDVWNERLVMDKVFEALRDNGSMPIYWAFNHFSNDLLEKRSNVIFRSLPNIGIANVTTDIDTIEIGEGGKKIKLSSKLKKISIEDSLTFDLGRDDGFAEAPMLNNEPAYNEQEAEEEFNGGETNDEVVEETHGETLRGINYEPFRYVDFMTNEAVGAAWRNADGVAANGLNVEALRATLNAYNGVGVEATTVTTTAMVDGTITSQLTNGNG